MQKITVKDFSCIKNAVLEVAPLTLVIGPQASGKSVLSKLVYFCTSIISEFDKFAIDELLSFESLDRRVKLLFSEWFPSSAWGSKRFFIKFQLGEFELDIVRVGKTERVRVKFCDKFEELYKKSHQQFLNAHEKADSLAKADIYDYELKWSLRQSANATLKRWLGDNWVNNQLFVPAGRSFFTSVGKALFAFEHSGILDPVTLEFGRKFSAIRERNNRRMPAAELVQSSISSILFSEILGGDLKTEGGKEYIRSSDGRLIPFSALSSGQQELLPLAVTIRSMLPNTSARRLVSGIGPVPRRVIYIEEPEAHLFPRAQNKLVEVLAALVTRRSANNLLLTTHSPYVLAKFNNLIKAGSLARGGRAALNPDLVKLLPESSWIPAKSVNAYAIMDGNLKCIMDETGLIAADYLDDVSGEIAREFTRLLAIEVKR